MKIILREYGTAVIAAITAALLLAACLTGMQDESGNTGLYRILEAEASQPQGGNANDLDNVAYRVYVTRSNPVISCHASGIYAKEAVDWQNIFYALDEEQKPVAVRIIAVNESRNIVGSYCFPKAGIYEVEVLAVDEKQKRTRQLFRLPVLPENCDKEEAI